MIKIHDIQTGEVIEREMDAEELAQAKTDKEKLDAEQKKAAEKATEKAALLEKLGITEDEAKLLLS
jgi:hypothetical protein